MFKQLQRSTTLIPKLTDQPEMLENLETEFNLIFNVFNHLLKFYETNHLENPPNNLVLKFLMAHADIINWSYENQSAALAIAILDNYSAANLKSTVNFDFIRAISRRNIIVALDIAFKLEMSFSDEQKQKLFGVFLEKLSKHTCTRSTLQSYFKSNSSIY